MQTDVRQEPQCSFCGKSQSDAAILIAAPPGSPPAFICEECVAVCNRLIEENQAKSASAMAPPKPAKKGAPKKDRQSKEQRSNEVLAAAASRVSITARGDPNYGEPLRITFTLKEPNISLVYIELLNESGELFGSSACVNEAPNAFATSLEQDIARRWFNGGTQERTWDVRRLVLRATLLIGERQTHRELVVYLTSVPMRQPGGPGLAYVLKLSGDC